MTDEQIKQNAEDIVNTLTIRPEACIYSRSNMISAAIAGAHSRDEEVEDLEQALACAEDVVDIQRKELDQLRNPWISVKDRLPKDDMEVIGMTKGGWVFLIRRNSNEWCGTEYRELLGPEITHWMPIPQTEKGE